MNKLKILLVGIFLSFGIISYALPAYAQEGAKADICKGIGLTDTSGSCAGSQNSTSVDSVIKSVINILTYLVGIASVIMIILAGFKYITSSGDSNAISSAKSTLTYAIIGLIIVALAQVIVRFVFTRATATPASTQTNSAGVQPCTANVPC